MNVAILEQVLKNVKTSTMFTEIGSLISNTKDGKFWYSAMGIVVCPRDSFTELWYSVHSVQSPSLQSRHHTFDGLCIWRLSHIPQKDGELAYFMCIYGVL
jgi:hypothetical protein